MLSSEAHHIRIVEVVRIEVKWIAFEPDVSQSGPLARWSLLIRNGENDELLWRLGPLGEVVRHGASFIASKDGFPIGTYNTFGEAMESLAWKGRTKAFWFAKAVERSR